MARNAAAHFRLPRQRVLGFSLIEIMVGLVIGMLSVIVIMRLFAAAEADKRTTIGGNSASVGGVMALYTLERDMRRAGYGMTSYKILGCNLTYTTSADSTSVTIPALQPVTINPATSVIPAGDSNTDTLLISYGSSNSSPEGDALTTTSTSGSYVVSTEPSFSVNDYVVAQNATRPSSCTLTRDKVTSVPSSGSTISVTPGVTGLPVNSIVFNMGPSPAIRAYAIRSGNLTMCDYMARNCGDSSKTSDATYWVPMGSNIVSMRAQYGRDTTSTSMVGNVLTYDQTTPGSTADTSGYAVYCSWSRVLALRVALVSRNPQFDKVIVTSSAPTWSGTTVQTSTAPTNPTAVTFNLSGASDWQYYRYKTLETTVPLRNLMWQGGQQSYMGGSEC